jgi:hypothetical protein
VIPEQDPSEIYMVVEQTDELYKLLFFNGTFTREVQASITASFSSIFVPGTGVAIKETLSDASMYYDTTQKTQHQDKKIIFSGCLVVEVLKNWQSAIFLASASSASASSSLTSLRSNGKERSREIMSQKSGKLSKVKSSNFKKTQEAVKTALNERSFLAKTLDSLFGVEKQRIEQRVLKLINED